MRRRAEATRATSAVAASAGKNGGPGTNGRGTGPGGSTPVLSTSGTMPVTSRGSTVPGAWNTTSKCSHSGVMHTPPATAPNGRTLTVGASASTTSRHQPATSSRAASTWRSTSLNASALPTAKPPTSHAAATRSSARSTDVACATNARCGTSVAARTPPRS